MRYGVKPKGFAEPDWWHEGPISPQSITVIETVDDAEPTGILDRDGNEYVRIKDPIGFKVQG